METPREEELIDIKNRSKETDLAAKGIMRSVAFFTDVSLNPGLKLGVGAYLALPASSLEVSARNIERSEVVELLKVRRFEDTSSTKLEVQTVLWMLEDYQYEMKVSGLKKLQIYSDSQCVSGLLRRRDRLVADGFLSRRTNSPLRNASLYHRFYDLHDELQFETVKVRGHSRLCCQDTIHRIFSFVDRETRLVLKRWMGELKTESLEEIKRISQADYSRDKSSDRIWWVYVLKCRNNYLYIGLTNNIERRLREHEQGMGSKFVRSQRPFELVKTIPCKDAGEARSLEYNLKRLKRSRKCETLGLRMGPAK